ncbi:MAG: RtcB family protein, partial [Promethearchaeia archaeon]
MVTLNAEKVSNLTYEIPKGTQDCMKVPVRIYASSQLIQQIRGDKTLNQATNVACLPGIYKHSTVLPDGHQGYGFPIGGVAALDYEEGVVSPGGVGYDINCGVRVLRTNMDEKDVRPKINALINRLYSDVPTGVGRKGKIRLDTDREIDNVLEGGAKWAVENGFGWEEDLKHTEANGNLEMADASKVSDHAKGRGKPQVGTLGSGNHFLEIQRVDEIYNAEAAKAMGITREGQVTIMIHSGSRGFGHQVCSDYIKNMTRAMKKYNIDVPDRQLCSAPVTSPEGQAYLGAMAAAANYAWA